jgi:pSer/pThr/pTyr-binding forkhead associated (FHA) protein
MDQSTGPAKTLDVAGDPVRLGRGLECEVAFDSIAFPKVSGLHARIESTAQGFVLFHLSRYNKTLLNDAPIDGQSPVKAGDRIRIGFTGPAIEILAIQTTSQGPGNRDAVSLGPGNRDAVSLRTPTPP